MATKEAGSGEEEAEGQIIIKHDLSRGPVTAVKAMLLQFSLGQLEKHGYLDRYVGFMEPDKLREQEVRVVSASSSR